MVASLALMSVASAGVYAWLMMTGRLSPWQSVIVTLRDGTQVQFERQRSHPTQAEYRRRCVVCAPAGINTSLSLPDDPGGGFPVEIRLHSDGTQSFLVITGADDYALDLRTGSRAFHEEGKYCQLSAEDSRLPVTVDGFLVGREMVAQRMTLPR